jgi:hypothetical protein
MRARVGRAVGTAAVVWLVAACGGDTPTAGMATTLGPPATGSVDLAPSQISADTVAAPSVPGRCDPAVLTAELGTVADELGAPDVVVLLRNDGDVECEVDIGEAYARAHDVEPTVWLAPGAVAELWGVATDPECAEPRAARRWALTLNGAERVVELGDGGECGIVPSAFFPA